MIPNDIFFPGFEVRVKVTKVVKVAIFKTYLVCHFGDIWQRFIDYDSKKHYRDDRHPHTGVIFLMFFLLVQYFYFITGTETAPTGPPDSGKRSI